MAKAQQVDLTNFENNINEFKNAFSKNYQLASKKFNIAIEEIDKTIDHLQKTKDALLSSENNLRLANNKAEEQLTIKKNSQRTPEHQGGVRKTCKRTDSIARRCRRIIQNTAEQTLYLLRFAVYIRTTSFSQLLHFTVIMVYYKHNQT